jgi:hypothetical protein
MLKKKRILLFPVIIAVFLMTGNLLYGKESREKIYLQTDRGAYIAGEHLFYKINLIHADEFAAGAADEIAYVILRNHHNTVISSIMVRLVEGKAWGDIYLPDTLSTGLYQMVAYTHVMKNFDKEFFCPKEIVIVNRFDKQIVSLWQHSLAENHIRTKDTIFISPWKYFKKEEYNKQMLLVRTSKKEYGNREMIQAEIIYIPEDGDSLVSLSVSVAEELSFLSDYKIQQDGERINKDITSGYATSHDIPFSEFLPERSGVILRGIVRKENHEPARGVYVLLSVPDSVVNLDYAITDTSGVFRFLLNDYYENKRLILSVRGSLDPGKYKIEIENKYLVPFPFRPVPVSFPKGFKNHLLRSQDIVRIQKIYQTDWIRREERRYKRNYYPPVIYSEPSSVIIPDDYVPLNDLMEIAKELSPYLRIRKKGEEYVVRIFNTPADLFFNVNPAVFLDGVLVKEISPLIPLDSKQIKKIELVQATWFHGNIRFPGILAVFSGNNAIDHYPFGSGELITHMGSFEKPSSYHPPRYDVESSENMTIPDFRQLLYWQPDITLKQSGKKEISFYSGDLSSSYIIEVTGVTLKGKKIVAYSRFDVKQKK